MAALPPSTNGRKGEKSDGGLKFSQISAKLAEAEARIAETLKQQWEAQKQSVEQLKAALRGLDNKIEEAKRKRNILVSRKKRAEAQRMINETLASINSKGSFDTFERMEDKITQLEAERAAGDLLCGQQVDGPAVHQLHCATSAASDTGERIFGHNHRQPGLLRDQAIEVAQQRTATG